MMYAKPFMVSFYCLLFFSRSYFCHCLRGQEHALWGTDSADTFQTLDIAAFRNTKAILDQRGLRL